MLQISQEMWMFFIFHLISDVNFAKTELFQQKIELKLLVPQLIVAASVKSLLHASLCCFFRNIICEYLFSVYKFLAVGTDLISVSKRWNYNYQENEPCWMKHLVVTIRR